LKLKSGLKNTYQELSPEQIVGVCSKTVVMCPTESIYQHIWKDKRKEFVFKSTNNWEKYRKVKRLRGILSNRRLIEDRPKIVDLKQRLETWRSIL
jgi:IS30 family transposase